MSSASDHATNGSGLATTLLLAGLAGASGVAIGAFGAHYVPAFLADRYGDAEVIARRLAQFDTGARYHLLHAAALLGLAGLQRTWASSDRLLSIAAGLFVAGIVLFSGSLYVLVLSGKTWLGAITPLGGLSWIIAWSLVAVVGWRNR